MLAACKEIHEKFPTPGIYNVQLIVTNKGCVFPFRINPRISTTFCLALAAGLDPLEVYIENIMQTQTFIDYTDNVRIQRFWYNNFLL